MDDVITHLIRPKVPYNQSVRKFSLVLSIKSKSAYTWVRNKFSKRLPALRTLRAWNANSNANCFTECGFNFQTLETLQRLANEKKKSAKNYTSVYVLTKCRFANIYNGYTRRSNLVVWLIMPDEIMQTFPSQIALFFFW